MFGIDAAADGRSEVSDDRFRDTEEADGIVVAQRVLQDADLPPSSTPVDWIAAAHAEIDRDEQREVDQLRPAAVFVQEGLKQEREKRDDKPAAVEFMNLDVGVRSASPVFSIEAIQCTGGALGCGCGPVAGAAGVRRRRSAASGEAASARSDSARAESSALLAHHLLLRQQHDHVFETIQARGRLTWII